MSLKWLRTIWALAAFVPLALTVILLATDQFGYVFLFCAIYLLPATSASRQLGFEALTLPSVIVAAVYCAAVGWLAARILSQLLRLPVHVERRRATILIGMIWVPIGAIAGYLFLDYKAVMSTEIQCPGHIYPLREHCQDITDFREHELGGFIDRTFAAKFRIRPGVLPDILIVNQMKELSPADVPESFWSQPPIWWTINRSEAAHVYKTSNFSFEGRGRDGDHYLFIEKRLTNEVFVYLQNNF